MNYRLIPMERAHLPQAAELERQCFSDPWTEAQLAGELRLRPGIGEAAGG